MTRVIRVVKEIIYIYRARLFFVAAALRDPVLKNPDFREPKPIPRCPKKEHIY